MQMYTYIYIYIIICLHIFMSVGVGESGILDSPDHTIAAKRGAGDSDSRPLGRGLNYILHRYDEWTNRLG